VSASDANGWRFLEWLGHELEGSTEPAGVVTMDCDKTITGVFLEEFTLTMAREGEQGGVSPEVGEHVYLDGDELTLSATDAPPWYFEQWQGDVSSEANPHTFAITADTAVTGRFVERYTLVVTRIGEGGSLSPEGEDLYDADTGVTVTASETADWLFDHWAGDTGDDDLATDGLEVVMNAKKAVTGVFVPGYDLSVDTSGSRLSCIYFTKSNAKISAFANAKRIRTSRDGAEAMGRPCHVIRFA